MCTDCHETETKMAMQSNLRIWITENDENQTATEKINFINKKKENLQTILYNKTYWVWTIKQMEWDLLEKRKQFLLRNCK